MLLKNKAFFFTFCYKHCYQLRDSLLSDRTIVKNCILEKHLSIYQKLNMEIGSEC